jgi:hypothetical protein
LLNFLNKADLDKDLLKLIISNASQASLSEQPAKIFLNMVEKVPAFELTEDETHIKLMHLVIESKILVSGKLSFEDLP